MANEEHPQFDNVSPQADSRRHQTAVLQSLLPFLSEDVYSPLSAKISAQNGIGDAVPSSMLQERPFVVQRPLEMQRPHATGATRAVVKISYRVLQAIEDCQSPVGCAPCVDAVSAKEMMMTVHSELSNLLSDKSHAEIGDGSFSRDRISSNDRWANPWDGETALATEDLFEWFVDFVELSQATAIRIAHEKEAADMNERFADGLFSKCSGDETKKKLSEENGEDSSMNLVSVSTKSSLSGCTPVRSMGLSDPWAAVQEAHDKESIDVKTVQVGRILNACFEDKFKKKGGEESKDASSVNPVSESVHSSLIGWTPVESRSASGISEPYQQSSPNLYATASCQSLSTQPSLTLLVAAGCINELPSSCQSLTTQPSLTPWSPVLPNDASAPSSCQSLSTQPSLTPWTPVPPVDELAPPCQSLSTQTSLTTSTAAPPILSHSCFMPGVSYSPPTAYISCTTKPSEAEQEMQYKCMMMEATPRKVRISEAWEDDFLMRMEMERAGISRPDDYLSGFTPHTM